MRSLATALVSVVMALSALGLAVAAPHIGAPAAPHAAATAAAGGVRIANSREGQAVFAAGAMRPGASVSGTVRIGNDGDVPGRFLVRRSGIQDAPGPYGGRLSERVQLVLLDVTQGQQPHTVYAGVPAGFDEVDLGTFAPGAQRDYRFTATLPDGGLPSAAATGDNRFQGAALSIGVEWRAGPAAPAPTPTPTTDQPPTVAPVTTPSPAAGSPSAAPGEPAGEALADAVGLPPAQQCVRSRRLTMRLKAPRGALVQSASVAINGKIKRRLNARSVMRPVRLRRLPTGRITLLVKLRTSDGRSYTTTRSYRSCAPRKVKIKVKGKRR
ncbi:MAG TPA: hypothetical protein VK631_21900 [Solirubrobacteraceae bacterium]|nr:hypothetical protein [Solirubrobacteraceae bacterium]